MGLRELSSRIKEHIKDDEDLVIKEFDTIEQAGIKKIKKAKLGIADIALHLADQVDKGAHELAEHTENALRVAADWLNIEQATIEAKIAVLDDTAAPEEQTGATPQDGEGTAPDGQAAI